MYFIYFLVYFCVFTASCQKGVTINGYHYFPIKKEVFLKEDQLMVVTLQYLNKSKEFMFGFDLSQKRNDTIFETGSFRVDGNLIYTTEKYFFTENKDSAIGVFKQLKNGKLIFIHLSKYKNGQRVYYFKNK